MIRSTFGDAHRRWASRIMVLLSLIALTCCADVYSTPEEIGEAAWPIAVAQFTNGGTGATSATFAAPETAGNLNVVVVGWADATTTVTAVTDTRGNQYSIAAPMTTIAGNPPLRQAIYYAKNISGGTNTVQVTFSGAPFFPDLRILEYAGLDPTSPFDVTASATGSATGGATVSSGNVTTNAANELIVGAGMTTWMYGAPGASFTQRVITSDGNIAEDRIVSAAGSYSASAVLSGPAQSWVMQVAAFKAAPASGCVPTTCAAQGKSCGTIFDGCGGTLTCGGCSSPATCGGSGLPNVCGSSSPRKYATDFNLTETPLSEGGAWKQLGLDWTHVASGGGLVHGTQGGSGGFDDSYAYLAGAFPANQSASAVIHLEPGITATFAEVEILLRWTDSAHNSIGYECNLAFNGQYAEIIKWPGPLGTDKSQFKFISSGNLVANGVHDGDVFQADVIGNVITSRLNGVVIATGVDSSITSGAPGIGFYSEGAAASEKFSFTKFSATGL